ncbi:zinc finger protein 32 [Colletotrichum tofieldiae]|nr:zinc finger protein 32 [Colletotrichum tofieldiae]GKT68811.1 zinc finger protein 32 [Colletotrichum tofieldiae]GKT88583.1 zinc finger protein 32 [Colletotrichum tofieldiae]
MALLRSTWSTDELGKSIVIYVLKNVKILSDNSLSRTLSGSFTGGQTTINPPISLNRAAYRFFYANREPSAVDASVEVSSSVVSLDIDDDEFGSWRGTETSGSCSPVRIVDG